MPETPPPAPHALAPAPAPVLPTPGKWTDFAFKVLSVLVIPLLLWGVKLQVGQAVQDTKIETLESEVAAAKAIKAGVQANTVTLGRVEEKLNGTNARLDEIRTDLRRSLPPR
jgi:hypothetical protein